jgi:hypothetical protein
MPFPAEPNGVAGRVQENVGPSFAYKFDFPQFF